MQRRFVLQISLILAAVVIAVLRFHASVQAWIVAAGLTVAAGIRWIAGAVGMDGEGRWAVFLMMFFVGWLLGELVTWRARSRDRSRLPLASALFMLLIIVSA